MMKTLQILFVSVLVMSVLVGCNRAERVFSEFDNTLPIPKIYMIKGNAETVAQTILAAQRYAAFWNTGDEKYVHEALAVNFKDINLPDGRPQGIEGVLKASKFFRTAVPNLKAQIKEMIVAEDKVTLQYQFTGNFTGNFKGKKGLGQAIDFVAVDIYTVKNGKIITNWHLEDNFTLLSKMGVLTVN